MSQECKSISVFWHYNKGKVFLALFFIMLIAVAFSQCSAGVETDLGILYVSPYEGVDGAGFVEQIKKDIPFSKTEGEPNVIFTSVCVPSDAKMPVESGQLDKMHVEFVTGDSTFFILDEETLYVYKNDGYFHDITSYADKYSVPEEARYYGENGEVIAISADANSYIESNSVKTDSLYLAVRAHTDKDDVKYKNTFNLLDHILKNK